ncbi:MAG: hypothetical protein RLZZ292_2855 [Bacteroidota bacterium]|jgi:4-amino-4-deoxy-L-arabinose transferase
MEIGWFVVIATLALHGVVLKLYVDQKYSLALYWIVLGGLLLRLYVASDPILHPWDERFHALVAKNMIDFPLKPMLYAEPVLPYNYQHWNESHVWLHKPPLPLWCIALSLKVFGINTFSVRLPSLIFGTFALFLTFYIGRFVANTKVGLLAAGLHSINGLVLEIGSGRITTDHVDTAFAFFIEFGVFFSILYVQKRTYRNLLGVGISLGAALLCKWLVALLIVPLFVLVQIATSLPHPRQRRGELRASFLRQASYLLYGSPSTLGRVGVGLLLIALSLFLPWQWFIFKHYPLEAAWEAQYNVRHFWEVIEQHDGSWWYHLDKARIVWNELIYVAFLWYAWQTWQTKNYRHVVVLCWIVVPYVFFSMAQTKMQSYLLFTAPAIFILLASFCLFLLEKKQKTTFFYQKTMYSILFVAIIVLAYRYSLERIKPWDNRVALWETKNNILRIGAALPEKSVLFNYPNSLELMFYFDQKIVYEPLPSDATIQDLQQKGYKVYLYDHNLPVAYRAKYQDNFNGLNVFFIQ